MIKKQKYPVYRCTDKTLRVYNTQETDEDEYGSNRYYDVIKEVPFESRLFWIQTQGRDYSSEQYYPIAPSGKYSPRYARLYSQHLRNMEQVGYFDGEQCDIHVPFLYRSVHELNPLDVFRIVKDYTQEKNLFRTQESFTLNTTQRFVLESFKNDGFGLTFETALISDLDSGETFEIRGEIAVEKVGRIELIRNFIEEKPKPDKHELDHKPRWDTNSVFKFGWACAVCGYEANKMEADILDGVFK